MYPALYIEFLAHFHGTRDYFECHEVLEEYWKEVEPKNRESVWVLLIQLAVCMYHYRRGNLKGATILIKRCMEKWNFNVTNLSLIGIDPYLFHQKLETLNMHLDRREAYISIDLPIIDQQLMKRVIDLCHKWNVSYGQPSNLADHFLVNKHRLRQRD